MKALSLTQPWAQLVAVGAKTIETRSWSTKYRGPLAIHAAKRLPLLWRPFRADAYRDALAGLCGRNTYGPGEDEWTPDIAELPRGAIVAVCELVDVHPTDMVFATNGGWSTTPDRTSAWWISHQEYEFGDYAPARWAWLLRNVRALPEPIPAKGALGLWETDLGVLV